MSVCYNKNFEKELVKVDILGDKLNIKMVTEYNIRLNKL